MIYQNIIVEIKNNFAVVKVNRPDKLNALNSATIFELELAFKMLNDNQQVRAIILTGSGEKAFVAGADIKEINILNAISAKEFAERGQAVFNIIENMEKPVIAAINGFALGGGCELALACHIRLASENAKLGQPEINLGIIPGYGGTQRLARLINSGRAAEYTLTGEFIDVFEAYRIGLVNHVYPITELQAKAEELAEKIASKPAQAVRLTLNAIRAANNSTLNQGLKYEASLFAIACSTLDAKEGTLAFLEKRKPNFNHN
jgi:enoyl-CoA hydratase